jgi:CRISPR-associated endonuclease Csy4
MDYYLDIKILPDPEFKETTLMNALFSKMHRALVDIANTDIGVSFPEFKDKSLGSGLRLHGTQVALNKLMALEWMKGLRDYTVRTDIQPIPRNTQHRLVKRVQAKSSVERLQRRSVAKGWVTTEEAFERLSSVKPQKLTLPFIQLRSSSTRQEFRLFIRHEALRDESIQGKFNAYGLSNEATIPWF